ncbi:venom acid phosphatase Acph-1-like [Tribolium madens]|uniref:venom acid phosphatase Acph-1-like n=1 Tax=Tribolium madens TaxID=41895 RepID=UPI001CF71D2F|nr:venom acid phosphatase Acph-1-like [Tribolium madens]
MLTRFSSIKCNKIKYITNKLNCDYILLKIALNTCSRNLSLVLLKMSLLFISVFAIFAAVVSANSTETTGQKEDTLVLLHVLFRHGNRTPDKMSIYPNDPHITELYTPFGYSQLTIKGKQTEYGIGKYLRETYGDFIPRQYTPDVVYAISTNFKRTKMSLELVMASLFPPLPSELVMPTLEWQPIPFNIQPSQGFLGVASTYCASYINAYFKFLLSEEGQEIRAEYKNLYHGLSKNAGQSVKTPRDVAGIYFALKSEEDYGLNLPEWTEGLYPDIIEEAASVDYEIATANPTLRKLSAGSLLKKIIQDSVSKQNGSLPEERKIFLYSAHEFNVATMLRTLNVFHRHVPPFGATIFFEIHNINGQYGLKLYYQDYTKDAPKLLTIPGCSSFCELDQLYELMEENLPGEDDVCTPAGETM